MSAFHFGQPDKPLFGYFHDGGYGADRAAVLCPSWGTEYANGHRAMRLLARRLTESGYHVLRFDYSGTGDSWGDTTDADLDRWQEDVVTAIGELQTRSGCSEVVLIGLRLGAYIAATAASKNATVGSVVLWDPVVDGQEWMTELAQRTVSTPPDSGDTLEFGSMLVSRRFYGQVTALDSSVWSNLSQPAALLISTTETGHVARVRSLLPKSERLEVVHTEDASAWIEDVSIWHGQVPVKALGRIVEWCEAR